MLTKDLDSFLQDNRIQPEQWESSNIPWQELLLIGQGLEDQRRNLEAVATATAGLIQGFEGVHSVRWRVKDPSHLMAKIVRKRAAGTQKYLDISVENYMRVVDDLIGLRALHLFKTDCFRIDQKVHEHFGLKEGPIAFVREGDNPELLKQYRDADMSVSVHPDNYRSIHYILITGLGLNTVNAELQVRTIFEEGWSEIDHKVRYPNFPNNQFLRDMLNLLNGMAGQADDAGGLIQGLATEIQASSSGERHDEQLLKGDHSSPAVDALETQVNETIPSLGQSHNIVINDTKLHQDSVDADSPNKQGDGVSQDVGVSIGTSQASEHAPQSATKISELAPSVTSAQRALQEHNVAAKTLGDMNRIGALVKAFDDQNAAAKAIRDMNQIGATVRAIEEQSAVAKAVKDMNRIGALVKAFDDQNAAAKAIRDMNQIGATVRAIEEQSAVAKAVKDMNRIGATVRAIEEQSAVAKAVKDMKPPYT